jgi:endonuclease YncB( thermonuclease family)
MCGLLKKALKFSAFFCACISINAYANGCPPQHIDESVRVHTVYDGDTLQLEDGRKVRLIGIDTPEVFSKKRHIPSEIKASGQRARKALQQQLNQVKMRIGLDYGQQRFDRYGRTLAHVFTAEGINVQAQLIKQGHAIAFTTPPNDRLSHCYQQQEVLARQAKRGIWQLAQYQLLEISQLDKARPGFQRLQGKVSQLKKTSKHITLIIGGLLNVRIYKKDWPNFSLPHLNTLQGKRVRVRGWLHKKKQRYQINLRHPDALTENLTVK